MCFAHPRMDAPEMQQLNCTALAAVLHVTSVWCILSGASTSANSGETLDGGSFCLHQLCQRCVVADFTWL